jgi:signal transduction histidine kinase
MKRQPTSTRLAGLLISGCLTACFSVYAEPNPLTDQLIKCADSVRQLRLTNRNALALALAKRCLPAVAPAGGEKGMGLLYFQMGKCEREQGRFMAGIDAMRKSVYWAERGRDTLTIINGRYALSLLYADQGDYLRAISQCHNNLRWYKRIKWNTPCFLGTYQMLVTVYERLNNQPAVDQYRAEHLRLSQQMDDPENLFLAYSNEASRLEEMHQYRQALVYQQRTISVIRRLPKDLIPHYLADQLVELAQLQRKLGQLKPALTSLNEASHWSQQYWTPSIQVLIDAEKSAVWLSMGRLSEAAQSGQKALNYARISNRPDIMLEALRNLQQAQERTGSYRAALQTAKAANDLADSLSTVAKTKAIADVETRYEVARKEAAILALRKETTIQRLQADTRQRELRIANQQRLWLGISTVFFLSGVLVISYLFRRAKFLQKETEQQRQTLEEQALELHQANTTKDRLFSIVSHDLRSSVHNVHQSLTQMRQTTPGFIRENEAVRQVERGIHHLDHQLNNLLYWSLAHQDGIQVHMRNESLSLLVADALDSFQISIESKSLHVLNETGTEWIYTDERLTMLVLRNILHNAIKFTPSGGQITLRSNQNAQTVVMRISDTGPGLAATQQQRDSGLTSERGTQVGLRVSQELMQCCQGSLQLHEVQPHGTEVMLTFQEQFPG